MVIADGVFRTEDVLEALSSNRSISSPGGGQSKPSTGVFSHVSPKLVPVSSEMPYSVWLKTFPQMEWFRPELVSVMPAASSSP